MGAFVVAGAVALAVVGWAFTFGCDVATFWVRIAVTVAVTAAYALWCERPRVELRAGSFGLGAAAALALYLIFFVGNALAPLVVPGARAQVGAVYGLGAGTSPAVVALLLLFVTGPGEELFWRAFLQERLQARWGPSAGFAGATALYGAVHVASGNLMLTLAALVAGAFWGLLWLWRRDLVAQMVSHALWSACIFAVLPIR